MPRALRERIPVQPFLEWAERRAARLVLAHDDGSGGRNDGLPYLMDEIGWDQENGMRRLRRWRAGTLKRGGLVERATVEDALWNAGVFFWEIYPEYDEAAA